MTTAVEVGVGIASEPRVHIADDGRVTIGVYNADTDTIDELLHFETVDAADIFISGVTREMDEAKS